MHIFVDNFFKSLTKRALKRDRPMFCRPFYELEKYLLSSKCQALMKVRKRGVK